MKQSTTPPSPAETPHPWPLFGRCGACFWLALFFFALPLAGPARGADMGQASGSLKLAPLAWIMEDPTGRLTAAQAAAPANAEKYQAAEKPTLNFGISSSAWWIRFTLSPGMLAGSQPWVLDSDGPGLYQARLFMALPGGGFREFTPLGRGMDQQGRAQRYIYFNLPQIKNGTVFYLQARSYTGLLLPLLLRTKNNHSQAMLASRLWAGLYLGVVLSLALYNLFLFFLLKDASYIWYVFFIGLMGAFFGFTNESFAIMGFWVAPRVSWALVCAGVVCGLMFSRKYLLTGGGNAPFCDRMLLSYVGAYGLLLVSTSFASLETLMKALTILGATMPIVVLGVAARRLASGFRAAGVFLVAWLLLLLGGVSYSLTYLGVVPYSIVGFFGFQIGSALESILLSLALAVRIRSLRQEKEQLAQAWERLRSIFDSVREGIVLVHPDSKRIVESNQGAARLLRRERNELANQTLDDILLRLPPGGDQAQISQGMEGDITTKDGELLPVLVTCTPVDLAAGRFLLYSLVDLTAQKVADEERLAREKLTAAIQTAGAVCHELNQPLQVMSGRLSLVRMRHQGDEQLGLEMSGLEQEVERMAALSRRLAKITKYEITDYVGRDKILDLKKASS